MCQCPISGYPHFYRQAKLYTRLELRCQCPVSGYPHFYVPYSNKQIAEGDLCQCPISGYPHFYDGTPVKMDIKSSGVNALSRAIPISTLMSLRWRKAVYCVNALSRAIPISTFAFEEALSILEMCQCPVSGYPHFYLSEQKRCKYTYYYVSMPCLGLSPFLRFML